MEAAAPEVRRDLPDDLLGYYDRDSHTVVVNARLDPREQRCTAAHEQIHAEHGHCGLDDPWQDRRQERWVEREAARRLVPLDDLMDALTWCHDLDEVAVELGVDMDTLLTRIECLGADDRLVIDVRMRDQGRGLS